LDATSPVAPRFPDWRRCLSIPVTPRSRDLVRGRIQGRQRGVRYCFVIKIVYFMVLDLL
jgi:hypothetical protein